MHSLPSLGRTQKKLAIFIPLWIPVLLLMLLLYGLDMISCCETQVCPAPDPEVIVVGESEIQANSDGTYMVTEGWMLERLEFEQALRAALERCEQQAAQ